MSNGFTRCRTEFSPGSRRSRPASTRTGGTAASRAYLHHRFSDDLDFFVNDDERFGLWSQRVVQALARSGDWHVSVASELKRDPVLRLLDSAENILANKLTAVVGRKEPRDLADIWGFCCRLGLSCEAALDAPESNRFMAI